MEFSSQHHAYIYYGGREIVSRLREELGSGGVVTVYTDEKWGIDESRALSTESHRTDGAGRVRHFILEITTITSEAQNALLKLFEEPPVGVVFHTVVPPGTVLLPTLRSRLISGVVSGVKENDAALAVYQALIRLPLSEQLAEVDARMKKKDMVWLEAVRLGGLTALASSVLPVRGEAQTRLFETLLLLGSRGAANKMLLEEVVLTVASLPKQR